MAPSQAEPERFFFLDDADRALVTERRGAHHRLGVALQLTTARFVGRFLTDPLDAPDEVLRYLADQLGIEDVAQINRYTERRNTPFEPPGGDPGGLRVEGVLPGRGGLCRLGGRAGMEHR